VVVIVVVVVAAVVSNKSNSISFFVFSVTVLCSELVLQMSLGLLE
jgi:hypothetical protein